LTAAVQINYDKPSGRFEKGKIMSPRRVDPALTARRREALIKAGYAEILENGLHATSIDSVVARANSSKGGALHYFHTKEDLLYAVLDWLLAELTHSLDQVAASAESPRGRLAAELELLFHSTEVNRKLYRVLFDYVSLGSRASRFRSLFADFFAKCRARDRAIIAEGILQQQFRQVNPEEAATTIRALVDGYCLQWLMDPGSLSVEVCRDRCRAVLGAYLLRG
jgi:TetR/AcrR family transcriptional regulator, transcriptional repressor of bet genes